MNQTYFEQLFQEKTISAKRELHRPSTVFDKNLDDFIRLRGDEFYEKTSGSYQYFMPDLQSKMAATARVFVQSERARESIRNGAPEDDLFIDALNAPPGHYMEMVATWFGWRLVPLARKYAKEFEQQEFAFQAEKSVRSWLAKADVVWEAIETMPDSVKNRESFDTWVRPLRADAERIKNAVLEWIDRNS